MTEEQRSKKTRDWVNQTQVIEMGFTKTMIKNMLPQPEEKQNPFYRCAPPMKVWKKELVLGIMQTDEYKAAWKKAQKRKKASQKAVKTKTENLKSEISKILDSLKIEKIKDKHLVRNTLMEKENWYDEIGSERGYYKYLDRDGVDSATLQRWVVNYIRHNLVSYDNTLSKMDGKVGKFEIYPQFKEAVLRKIAKAYPKYKEECERQIKTTYADKQFIEDMREAYRKSFKED